ncbi:hypothetical protein AYI68_g3988 [Smittium mucronatum]|uniref:Uncharacterized protein n=1 Tax=Smittium mucronatum TaxID=133383 RepID=A0A1R0GYB5_9FUNG|nr:hypothetical protein AYI68_g3988 [Smittium mucronatum]
MGLVMRNHELVESSAYPYGFAPKVDAWREIAEGRDTDVSVSLSIEVLELSEDLEPSVNLAGEPVMEDLVSPFLRLSLSFSSNPPVRFLPDIPTVRAVKTLSVVSTGRNERSMNRRSNGATSVLKSLLGEGDECASNSALGFAFLSTKKQQFRSDDLYHFCWYRGTTSYSIKKQIFTTKNGYYYFRFDGVYQKCSLSRFGIFL